MEAKELMIGDWVHSAPDESNIQILYSEDLYAIMRYDDGIEPIPLTEEILKVNGWTEFYYGHFEDDHRHFHRRNDMRLELSLIKGDNCFCTNFSLGRIDFYYVHELQHALRLCGLFDLADNFKVE